MPVWHEKTLDLQRSGAIRMVGIVQEQHGDRARLFMQWKEMDWPILVDSLDLLGVKVVPITVLIDEAGIVQRVGARPTDVEAFIAEATPTHAEAAPPATPDLAALGAEARAGEAAALRAYADALVQWGGSERLTEAIEAYTEAAREEPDDGPGQFRLGVAYRRRAESAARVDGDFAAAVGHWQRALEIDPNQYIFRRRIQQYGPRLDKPYPFYDWVASARDEITARGETPVTIRVEPSGAELAHPAKAFSGADEVDAEPDPQGRIDRDERGLVRIESVVVPHTNAGRATARIHVMLRPDRARNGHWNNEVDDLEVWVDPPAGWQIDRRRHTVSRPRTIVSDETRTVEFEIARLDDTASATPTIEAYALYYVCEGEDGTCLYLRQDVRIPLAERP